MVSNELLQTIRSYDASATEFARGAESYERFAGLEAAVEAFEAAVPSGEVVLDAGCGGGRDSLKLSQLGRTVIALDFSGSLLGTWSAPANVFKVRADMIIPPIRHTSVGGIWACASLLHLKEDEIAKAVGQFRSLLVPRGVIAVSMKSNGPNGWVTAGDITGPRWQTIVPASWIQSLLVDLGGDVSINVTGEGWYVAQATYRQSLVG